jgi:hypothetical protein
MKKLLKNICIFLGFASIIFFIGNYFIFSLLRPKMIAFQEISVFEESLINWFGVSLLLFLSFCLLSLLQIGKYLKNAKKITLLSLFLIASGVISLIFVFSDVALINDIGKQYRHGLSQPEWLILYPIITFQFITGLVFTYLHLAGFFQKKEVKKVVRDNNIFLAVQYVGIICGLMGLSLTSLGFLFSRAWRLDIHTTMTLIILLFPYFLAVIYWLITKLQEKKREWYDEKQLQDVGKSAFMTLVVSIAFMIFLFIANYNNLQGVISITWLPLYLFLVLFLFSVGNLYFNHKA